MTQITLQMYGHVDMYDVTDPTNHVKILDKDNAIHYENMSEAMASSLAGVALGGNFIQIQTINLGNGGTSIDPTGVINYLPTNTNNQNAALYNQTFVKTVSKGVANLDQSNNFLEVRHIPGKVYTDILVSMLLDYGEPNGQAAFDNSQNLNEEYVFDELGLFSTSGKMLTHLVFHPVQKSLNRKIKIDYTIRIQALTSLTYIG